MDQWHGYFIIRRVQANLSESNWADVVDLVEQIATTQGEKFQPAFELHKRGSLDTFDILRDVEIEEGTVQVSKTYSNEYIYEGRFAENAVSFNGFKNKLVTAFGVDEEDVTYNTGTQTLRSIPSIFATYRYNSTNRMIVGLFGWEDEDTPCTWEESRQEAKQYILDNLENWDQDRIAN